MSSENKTETSDAYAVFSPKTPFKPYNFELHPIGPHDIEVKITHSGVCYSDIHTVDGDWGHHQPWPVVPGHEIIGTVTKVGSAVKDIKLGMRVGVGPQAESCRTCHNCKDGQETYCTKGFTGTYGAKLEDGYITKGGYALYHRTNEHFAFPIPESLSSAETAPILCAGITVYTPLKNYKVGKGTRVGVIGIGGLGHMALQFANAMGAEVTAISSSADKGAEAKALGAHHFFYTKSSEDEWKAKKESFDLILNTTNVQLDWGQYFELLDKRGTFVFLGAGPGNIAFPPFAIIMKGITVAGSLIGPPGYIKEMLELCAQKNIKAQIESLPWTQVNEACDRVRKNQVRHRMVLVMPEDK